MSQQMKITTYKQQLQVYKRNSIKSYE